MGYSATADLKDMFDPGPLERSARRIADRAGEALKDGARRRTPVSKAPPGVGQTRFSAQRGRVPGTMKESWYTTGVDVSVSATGLKRYSKDALTDDPIAPHVEWPTRPHVIRPRPDRAPASVVETGKPRRLGGDPLARLRFVNAQGRVVYAAEVNHPGTQGVHMLRDSLAEVDATWVATIGREEVERWAREQARLVRT